MTTSTISMLMGALALATAPLLAGCGGTSAPAGTAPAPSSSQVASSAPVATPSSDPAQEKADVAAAAKAFVEVSSVIGYPDKSYEVYLDRLKPLMTQHGLADARSVFSRDKAKTDKQYAKVYAARQRANEQLVSPVTVTSVSADKATVTYGYRFRVQQKQGSGWKTVRTGEKDTSTLRLVRQDGTWLVDSTE